LTIKVLQEDILNQKVEIITNAANTRLNHAGGIAAAIS
jgi:O-acetyl-ADP-ribose deacetylase (regulator of RNase III)